MSSGAEADAATGIIRSARLDLVPLTLEVSEALLAGDRARAAELLEADLGAWPTIQELHAAFPAYTRALRADPSLTVWQGRAVVLRAERRVIGSANLKGRPTASGRVEVGYGLSEAYRGRGYAREAVAALLAWVFAQPALREVTAEIEPGNGPSVRLAEALGFTATGVPSTQHAGHEVWVLPREAYRAADR